MNAHQKDLHKNIISTAKNYRELESQLMLLLQKADQSKLFLELGYSSLFQYVIGELKLTEDRAYSLIRVARKCRQVPELEKAILKNEVTVSKAARVASVLRPDKPIANKNWIALASRLPKHKLERRVAAVHPRAHEFDRVRFTQENRLNITFNIDEKVHSKLRLVQDLESQRRGRPANFEDVLSAALEDYLELRDPVRVARRREKKRVATSRSRNQKTTDRSPPPKMSDRRDSGQPMRVSRSIPNKNAQNTRPGPSSKRKALPVATIDKIRLRFGNRCAYNKLTESGLNSCSETRWLDIHHLLPLSMGGTDHPDNLILICKNHHKWMHEKINSADMFCVG